VGGVELHPPSNRRIQETRSVWFDARGKRAEPTLFGNHHVFSRHPGWEAACPPAAFFGGQLAGDVGWWCDACTE
jgi:hypothetical protein